ncbi:MULTISPECIES: carbohydrate ABC transporter permease [Luteococcus]|uniref:N-Acetyl-D-glucosamine ABC transport system, permease protein 1 n=1 Tax=Luteococcus japonicus LSP_Lj1 TaxID=1255658 RepID=A0A1R4IKY4_9ACTN|nr:MULTISPECIES: sugar ABC transporter permease [Luteococcus]MDN5564177.1 sugar ABC transporter permease [Luteococcus sp.]SJN20244.1 N-Acetyl-D-glucosamine ABC transport system, permease protein 1 [Luteococcus japonicus LSP_Lj1]
MGVPVNPAAAAEASVPSIPAAPGRRGEGKLAALLLAPTVIGIALFTLVPIIGSIVLAFFDWDIISTPKFVGVKNFQTLASSPTIRVSFLNTFGFVLIAVTLQIAVAMTLAVLVQSKMPGWLRSFFRSVFFFPLILSAASVSLIMSYLFNEDFGTINKLLGLLGMSPVHWLTSTTGAMVVTVLVYVWQNFGFTFLLFIGGLASIPQDIYEASDIDGASPMKRFWQITMPLVSPTMLVATVMAIISALQIFDQPYVLTKGGPGDSTRTAVMVIYQSAFQELQFGLAAAIGLVLMLIIMLVTWLQFRLSKRFVFYM